MRRFFVFFETSRTKPNPPTTNSVWRSTKLPYPIFDLIRSQRSTKPRCTPPLLTLLMYTSVRKCKDRVGIDIDIRTIYICGQSGVSYPSYTIDCEHERVPRSQYARVRRGLFLPASELSGVPRLSKTRPWPAAHEAQQRSKMITRLSRDVLSELPEVDHKPFPGASAIPGSLPRALRTKPCPVSSFSSRYDNGAIFCFQSWR